SSDASRLSTRPPRLLTRGGTALAVVTLAVVTVGLIARPALREWLGVGAPPGPQPTVALGLLPVEAGGDPEGEFLGAGIASVIAGNFGSLPGVTVLTRASTTPFSGARDAFAAMQHALGVTHVVGLSLRTANGTAQLAARVYRPGVPQPVWSETL